MTNPFETPLSAQAEVQESIAKSVFDEWCNMFGIDSSEVTEDFEFADNVAMYDLAFTLGAQKFLAGFLSQIEDNHLDVSSLKSELDSLRAKGDLVALGKREQEVARVFQEAISAYAYAETTNHPADILTKKEMNCVGASLIGGMLLEEAGIRCVLAGGGSHSFLVMVTSDDRVFWQDMQDGKEKPELNNQELSAEKIMGTVTPLDIVAFARNPLENGMTFGVDIEHWKKSNPITIEPFLSGIEKQELINTGFQLTNGGKHRESLEILEIAMQKSPDRSDVYLGQAKALRRLGHYEEAIAKCKKALELDPTYSYVQDEMDEIVKQLNQQEK